METIFALASAQGRAGVSVIRLSGPEAWAVAESMCGPLPESHRASLRKLRDGSGAIMDEALVLPFEEGRSFTGEDVVEFHIHGSIAVIKRVLAHLGSFPGTRLAEPGEFTRRAMENERLDLAQVEGLADLIEAETEAQRKQALRALSGEMAQKVEAWRQHIIRAASLLEATIDFADEDVPVDVTPEVMELLKRVQRELLLEQRQATFAERVRVGFEVAILGEPNVGKSTFLNALAGREAAITSEIAGTTRDIIEVRMDVGGLPVTFLDTAGLRKTDDVVESIGIDRAISRASSADLRIVLTFDEKWPSEVSRESADILLIAKDDDGKFSNGVSGRTGYGVDQVLEQVRLFLVSRSGDSGLASRERHRIAIEQGLVALDNTFLVLERGTDFYEIAAEELRSVATILSSLIGRVDVENLLDEIFSSFCLGK